MIGTLRRSAWIRWLPPIDSESPSPVTTQIERSSRALASPVASAGARPTGQVDKDGKFTLTTFAANDGAPAGDYEVTVEWWVSKNDKPAVNRLPARYRQPERSGLRATVAGGGAIALPVFKLAH